MRFYWHLLTFYAIIALGYIRFSERKVLIFMVSRHLFCGLFAAFIMTLCTVIAPAAPSGERQGIPPESLAVTVPSADAPTTVQELLECPTLQELGAIITTPQYDGVVIVCDDGVNLRRSPVSGDILRVIRPGRAAHLVGEKDGWYQVVYNNLTGYISGDYCQLICYEDYAAESEAMSLREDLADYALDWLGVRYRYGGDSTSGTDCSGFTMAIFSHFGYDLPHSALGQFYGWPSVTTEQRDVGDLVFFSTGGDYIGHVGIYLGGGQFIHASTSQGVRIDSVYDAYYGPRYRGACRVLDS